MSDLGVKLSALIQRWAISCFLDWHIHDRSSLSAIAPLGTTVVRRQPTTVCAMHQASELAIKEELKLTRLHLKECWVVVGALVCEQCYLTGI